MSAEPFPAKPSWLRRSLRRIESFLGLLFCWSLGLVTLFVPIVCVIELVLYSSTSIIVRSLVGWTLFLPLLVWLRVHVAMFVATWRAQYLPRPLGIEAAALMPEWWQAIKPLAALWWFLHFAATSMAAFSVEMNIYDDPRDRLGRHLNPVGFEYFFIVLSFGLTFTGNTFLLLAISSIRKNDRLLAQVWRWRFMIDVIVAGGPALISLYSFHH